MSYVDKSLIPGESVQARAKLHWYTYFWPFMTLVVGLVGMVFARQFNSDALVWLGLAVSGLVALYGAVKFLQAWIFGWTTELAVTNYRVIAKHGLIWRETIEQILNRVDSIEVSQSLLGRILDFGSIQITGIGVTHTPLQMIADPLGFRRLVHTAIEKHPAMPGTVSRPEKGA